MAEVNNLLRPAIIPVPSLAPAPVSSEDDDVKFYVVSDPVNGGDYATDLMTRWPFGSQAAKKEWSDRVKAERITLSADLFNDIPLIKNSR